MTIFDFGRLKHRLSFSALILFASGFLLLLSSCSGRELKSYSQKLDQHISDAGFDKAMEVAEQAEAKFKDEPIILRAKGIALMGLSEYEQALQCFEQALDKSKGKQPGSLEEDISYYRAAALYKLERYEQAYEALEDPIKTVFGKKNKEGYLIRGMAAIKLGRKQEAAEAFDKAIEADKENFDLYIDIYQAFANNNYIQSGKDYLSRGIKTAQNSGDRLSLGKLYYYNEEYAMVVKSLEGLSNNKEAKIYLAKAFYKKDDLNGAYQIAEQALADGEDSGEYHNIIGIYHLRLGEYDQAIRSFAEGIKLNDGTTDCELRYNEAVAYEFIGDFSTAGQKMEELIKKYPDLKEAQREFLFLKTR